MLKTKNILLSFAKTDTFSILFKLSKLIYISETNTDNDNSEWEQIVVKRNIEAASNLIDAEQELLTAAEVRKLCSFFELVQFFHLFLA